MPLAFPWSINAMACYCRLCECDALGKPATGLSTSLTAQNTHGLDLGNVRGWQQLKSEGMATEKPLPGGRYSHYRYDYSERAQQPELVQAQPTPVVQPKRARRIPRELIEWMELGGDAL